MKVIQQCYFVVDDVRGIRADVESFVEPFQCLFVPAKRPQGCSDRVAHIGAAGIEPVSPLAFGQTFLRPFKVIEHPCASLQRRGVVRQRLVASVKISNSLAVPFELAKENPGFVQGVRMIRIQPERVLIAQERLIMVLLLNQNVAHLSP